MGIVYFAYLDIDDILVYCCDHCKTHLSSANNIISKQFHGQHGQAYLFDNVDNIVKGEDVDRSMTTGLHTVRDISCRKCKTVLGWTYVKAYNEDNKYKEGKFILEKKLLGKVE